MHWIWRNFIISTLLAIGVFYFIYYSETSLWPIVKDLWLEFLIVIFLVNIGGAFLFFSNLKLNKIIPWNKNMTIRFLAETISGIIIFLFLALIFVYAYVEQIIPMEENSTFWAEYWDGAVKFVIITVVIIYIYSLVNFSVFSYSQYAYVQIEKLSIERDQVKLQFEALKSQLSPHFLFNALNTISSLLYKDIQTSENYIRKLAKTYQYILKTDKRKLVRLSEELDMVKAFYFMQKIKYEDCLDLEVNISPALSETMIPPLTIQMLVENALKHNKICNEQTLKIEIYDEGLKFIVVKNNVIQKPELIEIDNNLVERPHNKKSHKIGLKNIRQRYKHLANKDIEVVFDEFFTVKLPTINLN
jgi:sensor histidine kinase YesM